MVEEKYIKKKKKKEKKNGKLKRGEITSEFFRLERLVDDLETSRRMIV